MKSAVAEPFTDTRSGAAAAPAAGKRYLAAALAALLCALLVLVLGIALGRASVDRGAGGRAATVTRHDRAVPGVGPRAAVHGVGTGWAHTRAGAVGAATAYTVGINSRVYVADPSARRDILEAIITPDESREIDSLVGDNTVPPPGNPLAAAYADTRSSAYRYVPVGYKVESYTDSAAEVSVWGFSLYAGAGSANVAASTAWATAHVPLRWADGDWKLDAAAVSQDPGPTPAVDGTQSSDLAIIAADQGFATYGYASR